MGGRTRGGQPLATRPRRLTRIAAPRRLALGRGGRGFRLLERIVVRDGLAGARGGVPHPAEGVVGIGVGGIEPDHCRPTRGGLAEAFPRLEQPCQRHHVLDLVGGRSLGAQGLLVQLDPRLPAGRSRVEAGQLQPGISPAGVVARDLAIGLEGVVRLTEGFVQTAGFAEQAYLAVPMNGAQRVPGPFEESGRPLVMFAPLPGQRCLPQVVGRLPLLGGLDGLSALLVQLGRAGCLAQELGHPGGRDLVAGLLEQVHQHRRGQLALLGAPQQRARHDVPVQGVQA